jgi:hypothetical protein
MPRYPAATNGYALRRKREARTRSRNCSGVGGVSVGGAEAGFGVDGFGRRAVKGDALVIAKHGLAVDWRHFPAAKHAERVRKRPAHCRGDLTGDAHRQRANVLRLDRKCKRPFLPEHRELLPGLLAAAISLDPICRRHAHSSFSW